MGKLAFQVVPSTGYGFAIYDIFDASGTIDTDSGSLNTDEYALSSEIRLMIKKSLAKKVGLPSSFTVSIEWDSQTP